MNWSSEAQPDRSRPAHDAGPDDAALVEAVVSGDARAFERLYQRHHAPLFRTALALTRRRVVAEELLQETFLRAFRHVARVRLAERASLRPWLHRILIHLVYDWSARHRPHATPFEDALERLASPLASPERSAEQRELARVVGEALEGLPLKQRVALVLFYLHDMEVDEISATIGVPEGTVKSRLYYGRARLRACLAADTRVPARTMASATADVPHGL